MKFSGSRNHMLPKFCLSKYKSHENFQIHQTDSMQCLSTVDSLSSKDSFLPKNEIWDVEVFNFRSLVLPVRVTKMGPCCCCVVVDPPMPIVLLASEGVIPLEPDPNPPEFPFCRGPKGATEFKMMLKMNMTSPLRIRGTSLRPVPTRRHMGRSKCIRSMSIRSWDDGEICNPHVCSSE